MSIREGMLQAVEDEIREVRRRLGDLARLRLVLQAGRLLEPTPGAYVYQFSCSPLEEDPGHDGSKAATTTGPYQIPEDSSGVVVAEGRFIPSVVIVHDPIMREVVVEMQLYSPLAQPERAEMSFSTIFLLSGLQTRLRECIQSAPLPLVQAALCGNGFQLASGAHSFSAPQGLGHDQANAIKFALANSVTYVWGPPGTGKTRTLAHLVRELLAAKESVLLTANTNVAVDRFVESTLDVLGSPAHPTVIRLGRMGRGLRGRGVSPDEVLRHDPSFTENAARFERMVREINIPTPDRWSLDTLLRLAGWALTAGEVLTGQVSPGTVLGMIDIAKAIFESVETRTVEVPAVATTLCGTFTRPQLRARRFDTVIVDEASMASVAHFAAAASLASRRIVIAGDFQQLPPIVLARTPEARRFLGQHVFAFVGCDDVSRDHPLQRVLTEQWRMHPEIRQIVSKVFYGQRLADGPGIAARRGSLGGVLLVDSHGFAPRTTRTRARSIRNNVHAECIADWVIAAGWKSIGVITPYRAQARAIRAAIRSRCRDRLDDGTIQVSTVHKFQGEERDLIVFDSTDAPGASGNFLNDIRNPSAANLVNVAISRAKHALLVVGDLPHLRKQLGTGSALFRVIREAMAMRDEVDAADPADSERLRTFLAVAGLPA